MGRSVLPKWLPNKMNTAGMLCLVQRPYEVNAEYKGEIIRDQHERGEKLKTTTKVDVPLGLFSWIFMSYVRLGQLVCAV